MGSENNGVWLNTDEYKEAVGALEMVCELLPTICSDTYRWKWAIIAMHNALQGFMVLATKGSNSLATLNSGSAKKLVGYWEGQNEYPEKRKLDYFFELFVKIQAVELRQYVHSKPYVPVGTHICSVKKLNELRNSFIHFVPKLFSIEVHGLPDVFRDCLEIIGFLGWQGYNFLWHDEGLEQAGRIALSESFSELRKIAHEYGLDATRFENQGAK